MSYANKIGSCEYCGCTLDSTDQVFWSFNRPVCPPCYENMNDGPPNDQSRDDDYDDRQDGAYTRGY